MATFTPPTETGVVPAVLPATKGLQRRLFRHYRARDRGQNVYIINGVATTNDPSGSQVATRTFYGGHVTEEITTAERTILVAGGFIADTPPPATWGALADEAWGALAGRTWGTLT